MRFHNMAALIGLAAVACGSAPAATTSTTRPTPTTTSSTTPPSTTTTTAPRVNEMPNLNPGGITLVDSEFEDGTPIFYAVVVPEGFDPAREYPVFLVLPPGGQDAGLTYNVTEGWYMREALARGWVVSQPGRSQQCALLQWF